MRPTELEEWQKLQAIEPLLRRLVHNGITRHENMPHLLTQYTFLREQLDEPVISVPIDRDFDPETIHLFKEEITELLRTIHPILLQILPNYSAFLSVQEGPEQSEAIWVASVEALPLSDAELIIPPLTSFNRHIKSIFGDRLHRRIQEAEESEEDSAALYNRKRLLMGALFKSLWRMRHCKRQKRHHMLLKGVGQSWHTETKLLMSLFLSSCEDSAEWQEVECLADDGLLRDEYMKKKLRPLQGICKDITSAQDYNQVLNLLLHEGALYKQPREQKRPQRRTAVQVKTLDELIENQRFSPISPYSSPASKFTVPRKRELSFNLAWCFWYLFDCPWAQNAWSADNISLRLSTNASSGHIEFEAPPYIRCDPEFASSEKGSNGSDDVMKDSVFLALGKLLVEIELGMRITSTERNRNGQPSLWLTLDKILEEDRLPSVGDDYLNAIEACLDLHQSNSELMLEERTSELSRLIYDSIVVNLEKEFSRYRKSRKRKRRRDVSPSSMDLGLSPVSADTGSIQIFKSRIEETNIAGAADLWNASFRNSSPLKESANNRQSSIQPEESGNAADQGAKESSKQPQITTEESVMTNRRVTRSMSRAQSLRSADFPSRLLHANSSKSINLPSRSTNPIQVLDDLEPDVSATDSRALRASNEFFSKMEGFLESYLPRSYTEPSRRAKVCIIDTGIDLKHPSVQGAKKRLREMISFKGDSMEDETGHGTLVAELVLRLAPEATLCVAKVAVAKTMPEEDTQLITRAIYWAVLQDADIISLSLALDLLDPELDYAIKKATEHGKIIVAAAGNDGLNMLRAYPASNRNVLCIHASDGKGKEGGISPNAWDNDDNFMTLGVDISLNWRGKPIVKSGTSFATAVAAAIAADALAIISPAVSEDHRKRLHSSEGMRLIFALLSKPSGTGYRYVAPWNLWGEDRSDKLIRELILDTLKR